MKKKPLYSIIIPTYNRALELNYGLNSLVSQTYKNFEVILCDDGSDDDTHKVFLNFKSKLNIKYIKNENWGGPAKPRNNGIKISKGKFICFLDSDDWFYPNKLEVCSNYLKHHDVLYHDMHVYKNYGQKAYAKRKSRNINGIPFNDLLLNGNFISNSTTVIRKSIIDKVGGVDEDKKLIAVEDYDLWIRISLVTNKFKYIPQYLSGYYWNKTSFNISYSTAQIQKNEYIFKKFKYLLNNNDIVEAKVRFAYRKARLYQILNLFELSIKNYKISIKSNNIYVVIKSIIFLMILKIKFFLKKI